MASLWRSAIARLTRVTAPAAAKQAKPLAAAPPPKALPPAVQTPPASTLDGVKAAVGKSAAVVGNSATAVTAWSKQMIETASKATPSPSEWASSVADRAKKAATIDPKTTQAWMRKTTTVAGEVSRAAIQQTSDKATAAARGLLWRVVGIVCLVSFAVSLGAAIPGEVRQYIEGREARRNHAAAVTADNHRPRSQHSSGPAADGGHERME